MTYKTYCKFREALMALGDDKYEEIWLNHTAFDLFEDAEAYHSAYLVEYCGYEYEEILDIVEDEVEAQRIMSMVCDS